MEGTLFRVRLAGLERRWNGEASLVKLFPVLLAASPKLASPNRMGLCEEAASSETIIKSVAIVCGQQERF